MNECELASIHAGMQTCTEKEFEKKSKAVDRKESVPYGNMVMKTSCWKDPRKLEVKAQMIMNARIDLGKKKQAVNE